MPCRDQVSLLFFIEISNSVIGHILSLSKLPFRTPTQSMLGLSTTLTQCGPWIPIFYVVALILSDALLSFSILFRNSSSKWQANPTSLSLSLPRSWPWNSYLVISMTSSTESLLILPIFPTIIIRSVGLNSLVHHYRKCQTHVFFF